jgi:GNAT superfamily N-acetyltransferase
MNSADILSRYDQEVRCWTGSPAPGFRTDRVGPVIRLVGPGPEAHGNAILWIDPTADAGSAIAEQIAFFGALGHAFEWKHHSHDRPADLPDRLLASGFRPEEPETFVALDTALAFEVPLLPDTIRIERLIEPSSLDAIAIVHQAVYGDPDQASWLAGTIAREKQADPDSIDIYAAYDADRPVSIGWMRHKRGDSFGSLWGGSTLRQWRGHGVYSALVAIRAQIARERGCRWLTVDCSPMSLPILERRGFQALSVITPFIWSPA